MKRIRQTGVFIIFIWQIFSVRGSPEPLTSVLIYDGPVYMPKGNQHGCQTTLPTYPPTKPDRPCGSECHIPQGCQIIYPNQQAISEQQGIYHLPGNTPNYPGNCQKCPVECNHNCACGCKTPNSLPLNTASQHCCPGYCQNNRNQNTPGNPYLPNVYNQQCSPDGSCSTEPLMPNKIHYSKVIDGDLISFTYDIGQEVEGSCGCNCKFGN